MNARPIATCPPATNPTECIALRYPLPPQSTVAVSSGAHVAPGDVLACATRPPIIVPVAAELGATNPDGVMTTIPPVGTVVRAGERIASLRRGPRTLHARAPVTGTIAALHPSGIVMLIPTDSVLAIRARSGGTVASADETRIVVETAMFRIPVAFGTTFSVRDARLVVMEPLLSGALMTRVPISPLTPDRALVVAHVADVKALAYARKSGGALLIIGSVTEAVAWELSAHATHEAERSDTMAALVLAGPGDAEIGVQAITPLRTRNGATVMIDGETRTLLVLDETSSGSMTLATSENERGVVFRVPAAWGEPGTMIGPIHEHALETGFRVLAAETTSARRGAAITPIQNLGNSF